MTYLIHCIVSTFLTVRDIILSKSSLGAGLFLNSLLHDHSISMPTHQHLNSYTLKINTYSCFSTLKCLGCSPCQIL